MSVRARNQNRPSGLAHGVLVVDKPKGMTSHDVVSRVRRAFGTRRVGHAGTLDPMATGVLVALLGEATKLSSVLTTDRKTYEATVEFGTSTDSWDAEGKVLKSLELTSGWLKNETLACALEAERERRLQIPPQVSAIKVDGKRAYARARQGETVEMQARDVEVHDLELLNRSETSLDLRVCVSKGYYVRALARDIGDHLGVPSHLSRLRRTMSGPFALAGAASLPLSGTEPLLSLARAARLALPELQVTDEGAIRLSQGKRLRIEELTEKPAESDAALWVAFHGERAVALVEPSDNGEFRVKRGLNDPQADASGLPRPEDAG